MNKDIRWRQRFQNFEKAFGQLDQVVSKNQLSEIERAGLIQYFEFTFELARKTLKDYLEAEGFEVKSPRSTIKQAFQIELINNGSVWLDAWEDRNIIAHAYDENECQKIVKLIKEKYYPEIKCVHQMFKDKFKDKLS